MNKHLNIFTSYAKDNRSYQLENDLTRALAICFQEDTLFFHEVLKAILGGTDLYNQLFEDLDNEAEINIDIQKRVSDINDFDHVFAVSLSESEMSDFWAQTHDKAYDPVCDIVVSIDNILIVIEAKRDNVDCTSQLYNQILNIYKHQEKSLDQHKEEVTPFDLNWPKLMEIAVKVISFEKSSSNTNRFLSDFIDLVKKHNFRWLPEPPISALRSSNKPAILRRIDSALTQLCKDDESISKLDYNNRLGCTFSKGWANEVLFSVDHQSGDLIAAIYPGNTRGQGHHIFHHTPEFHEKITVANRSYPIEKIYHINFRGQSFITGLWLAEKDFKKPLYTKENFLKHSGRKHRDQWDDIVSILDEHISADWKAQSSWEDKVINSNRSRFDMAFGYEIALRIPFVELSKTDRNKKDISPLIKLMMDIYRGFESGLLKEVEA